MIPESISKPGIFVLSFPEEFELCVCSGICSRFAVAFPIMGLVCVSFTTSFAVGFPVIAKGENPEVCAVKYR